LQTRGWEDEAGNKHYRTEVVANEMIALGERREAQAPKQAKANEAEEFPF